MGTITCLILVVWMCGRDTGATEECPDCDDSRIARLEYIKWQILQKLGMETPPEIEAPVLPEFVYEHLLSDSSYDEISESYAKEDFYGKTSKVVIFPNETIDCEWTNSIAGPFSSCYQLQLSMGVGKRSVTSADFWIYLPGTKGTTMCVLAESLPNAETKDSTYSVLAQETRSNPSSGWLRFDITKVLAEWIQNKQFAPKLAASCSSDLDRSQEPFLSIHVMQDVPNPRRRRSVECQPEVTACCREKLEVSFEDFGWKWVISPRTYHANHCRGKCVQDLSAAKYLHTTVLQAYLSSGPKQTNHTISFCCTPDTLKPLTMIYMDVDGFIYKKVLPNMIIDSCSCAF